MSLFPLILYVTSLISIISNKEFTGYLEWIFYHFRLSGHIKGLLEASQSSLGFFFLGGDGISVKAQSGDRNQTVVWTGKFNKKNYYQEIWNSRKLASENWRTSQNTGMADTEEPLPPGAETDIPWRQLAFLPAGLRCKPYCRGHGQGSLSHR